MHDTTIPPGVAVIGMAGRFPGADNIETFWQHLRAGTDLLRHFTDEELAQSVPPEYLKQENYVKSGYVLEQVEHFDAAFFGYTAREAELIDPQQRLFLECAWEAFEDAAYVPGEGLTGVYASATRSSYLSSDNLEFPVRPVAFFDVLLGNDKDYVAGRVSYKLNLQGPAMMVQCACSSSLVGVAVACQGLLDFHCDMALAGGVSITLPEKTGYLYSEEGGLAKDGRCHAFDHQASGMVPGNGLGVVLLKRLEDALRDKDHIYGVIRGFALNNDGADKLGFMAPSVRAQEAVLAEALALADMEPGSISYIEAHGTGTPMGDPMEARALASVYGKTDAPCALGSVKTNIGHLNSAAGVASLIKTMLCLRHATLVPSLNFIAPNPEIDLINSRFRVQTSTEAWTARPKRAGISSFGLGGSNCHLLVEEAPARAPSSTKNREELLVLSAKTPSALDRMTERLHACLQDNELELADLAYTLQVGRAAFGYRQAMVVENREQALFALEKGLWSSRTDDNLVAFQGSVKKIFFLFPGTGSQYPGMGAGLYQDEPVYCQTVEECLALLPDEQKAGAMAPLLRRLLSEAQPLTGEQQASDALIDMLGLFISEYALARLWMHWGIQPAGCAGHSLGQYVAATISGVFSLQDALAVVCKRAELIAQSAEGAMALVFASEEELLPLLHGSLSLAAINAPDLCSVSGILEDMDALLNQLKASKKHYRRINASRAGHSSLMEPVLEPFRAFLDHIPLHEPGIPFVSNHSGSWMSAKEATSPQTWVRHIRETVRFADTLATLASEPEAVLLEVGPNRILTALAKRHPRVKAKNIPIIPSMRESAQQESDRKVLLKAYGALFVAGVNPDWFCGAYGKEDGGSSGRRISLPTYPFERQPYWSKQAVRGDGAPQAEASESRDETGRSLVDKLMAKQGNMEDWFTLPGWRRSRPLQGLKSAEYTALPEKWLLFADVLGLGSALARRLEELGCEVRLVVAGESFMATSLFTFTLDPTKEEDYGRLFKHLRDCGFVPERIVHSWTLGREEQDTRGLELYAAQTRIGYQSLISLMRGLSTALPEETSIDLALLTSGLQSVSGEEILAPEKSLVLGPCKVIPSEFLHAWSMNIDLEPLQKSAASLNPSLIDTLIRDIAAMPENPEQAADFHSNLAYRGCYVWEQTFDQVRIAPTQPEGILLQEGGSYLITGGFGGVAFALAEYLAFRWQAKLTLTGRTAIPPRAEWDNWLASHGPNDPGCDRINKIRALEAAGAEVLAFSADTTDKEAMGEVWQQTIARFGRINGVFHAASDAASSMILAQNAERAQAVIGPKVQGSLILEQLSKETKLDFLLFFSSISSHIGALGHTDYTAACIFMDTLAQRLSRERNFRVVSVNWGYWQDLGFGRVLLPKLMEMMGEQVVAQGLLADEGMECMLRILSSPYAQVVVSTSDYRLLVREFGRSTKKALRGYSHFKSAKHLQKRPRLAQNYEPPRSPPEEVLALIWQDLLGISGVGVHDSFGDLGGDSLHALPMVAKVEEIFRIKIPIRVLMTENTVAKIAAFLVENETQAGQVARIAEIFLKVKAMSPEQIQQMLQEQQQTAL